MFIFRQQFLALLKACIPTDLHGTWMILAGSDPVLGGNVSSWIIVSDSQLCQQNKTGYIPSNSYETLIQFFGHLPARYFQCILVDSSSRRSAISTHRHDKMHLNGNYYFDEISRYLAIYISTILRPLTCSVVELIQLLLLYTERNAAVISRLNGRFFFRSIYRTKRGRYLTT